MIQENIIHLSRREYREEYLKSDEWREKSRFILNRDKICRMCDKNPSCDTHHLTYERIGFEDLNNDLIGLCRKCHNRIHRHKELSELSNFQNLKDLFLKSLEYVVPSQKMWDKLEGISLTTKKKLAGVLSILPENVINHLKAKKKFSYFKYEKIFGIIDRSRIKYYSPLRRKEKRIKNVPLPIWEVSQFKKEIKHHNYASYEYKKGKLLSIEDQIKEASKELKKRIKRMIKNPSERNKRDVEFLVKVLKKLKADL